jgi:hypothetical protein
MCQYIDNFQAMFQSKQKKAHDLQNLLSFHSHKIYGILFGFLYYVFRLGLLLAAVYEKISFCFTYYTNTEVQIPRNVILFSG